MKLGDVNRFQVKEAPEDETVYLMDRRNNSCALILSKDQAEKLAADLSALHL